MSGHSKWATIKRAKAVTDAKKSSLFSKLANNITIAAKKGQDPNTNFSLRLAIERAKSSNMPKENIERAIKRAQSQTAGSNLERLIYEGFGPAKSAFILEVLTDNKNRAAAKLRHLFSKHGGSLASSGSISWNFERKGVVRITKENLEKEDWNNLELELINKGADDIKEEKEGITIFTSINDLQKLKNFLDNKNIKTESAEIEYVAKEERNVNKEDKEKISKFIEDLEDDEEINNYYTNVVV